MELVEVKAMNDSCVFSFKLYGYSTEETLALRVLAPGIDFVAAENLPYIPGVVYQYPINPWDPTGTWLLSFIGSQNSAQYTVEWTGTCEETG